MAVANLPKLEVHAWDHTSQGCSGDRTGWNGWRCPMKTGATGETTYMAILTILTLCCCQMLKDQFHYRFCVSEIFCRTFRRFWIMTFCLLFQRQDVLFHVTSWPLQSPVAGMPCKPVIPKQTAVRSILVRSLEPKFFWPTQSLPEKTALLKGGCWTRTTWKEFQTFIININNESTYLYTSYYIEWSYIIT